MVKKQILLVDDELMLLYSLKRMLDDLYDITIAAGGRKAIDLINDKNNHYDLIICDVSMPDVNGVNLYLYIAKHHPELQKKIIFMTGGPSSVYLDDFFMSIDNIRLSKPFEYEDLRQTIKDYLEANPA
ncbi:MAG: response regulator [Pseudomonadota bacterium]